MHSLTRLILLVILFQAWALPASWAQLNGPLVPDSDLITIASQCNYATLTWTPGSGTHSLVLVQDNQSTTPGITQGTSYYASTIKGYGSEVSPGVFAVYADTGRTVSITGLEPGHTYRFDVISYTMSSADIDRYPRPQYSQTERPRSATAFLTTSACPSVQPTKSPSRIRTTPIDCSTAQITVHPGNGEGRLIVVSDEAGYSDTQPVDGQVYFPFPVFGQGSRTNQQKRAFVVSMGADTTVTVYGLAPNRHYLVSAYEYNYLDGPNGTRSQIPDYEHTSPLTAQAMFSVAACSTTEPATPATGATALKVSCREAGITYSPGDGDGRLVVMRVAGGGIMLPTQGQRYTANARFGLGDQTQPGCYVVQIGNNSALHVTGLRTSSVYQLAVFEYHLDSAGNPVYLLSQPPADLQLITDYCDPAPPTNLTATYSTPFTYDQGLTQFSWTPGDAQQYVMFIREVRPGRPGLVPPVDGRVYTSSRGGQEMVPASSNGDGTYTLINSDYSGAGATGYLRNASIGHTYEVAVYEYSTFFGIAYNQTPARLTFTAGRFAPQLRATVPSTNQPAFTWTTAAEYQSVNFRVQRSKDGITFTDIAGIIPAADSSRYTSSYKHADGTLITDATFYRVQMTHQSVAGQPPVVLYSNVVRVVPVKPLPVQLVSFKGAVQPDNRALLTWQTAQELNSLYFDVQRSRDGQQFTSIGKVGAAGTTHNSRVYQALDVNPLAGPTYYRLRQVDTDSATQYSSVVVLRPGNGKSEAGISVYPNPATGSESTPALQVALKGLEGRQLTLQLFDATGRIVASQVLPAVSAAYYETPLPRPTRGLSAGVYLVRVTDASQQQSWQTRLAVQP